MKKSTALILFIIICILAVAMRGYTLIRGQFGNTATLTVVMEAKQAVSNAYPFLTPSWFAEQGILNLIVIPYSLLSGLVGIFSLMYLIKIAFTIISIAVVYLLAKRISSSQPAGLIAALIYALAGIPIYLGALNLWHGYVFAPTLSMLSLLLLVYAFDKRDMKSRLCLGLASISAIVLSCLIWDGGVYSVVLWAIAIVALALADKYTRSYKKVLLASAALILVLWIILVVFLGSGIQGIFRYNVQFSFTPPFSSINSTSSFQYLTDFITQVNPFSYQISTAYSFFINGNQLVYKMPYLMWAIGSCISAFAIGIIAVFKFIGKERDRGQVNAYIVAVLALLIPIPLILVDPLFNALACMPLAILCGSLYGLLEGRQRNLMLIVLGYALFVSFGFTMIQITTTPIYSGVIHYPVYDWIAMNTPANSVILTFNGDGTAVEYWGHRLSLTDTNINDQAASIGNFTRFLRASAGNFSYLANPNPSYVEEGNFIDTQWVEPSYLLMLNAGKGYLKNESSNDTNFALLTNLSTLNVTSGSITLSRVYFNSSGFSAVPVLTLKNQINDTTIVYKIERH